MPPPNRKGITVLKAQWDIIQKLVTQYPGIAGKTVGEFYRVAAQLRVLDIIEKLHLHPMEFLVSEEEQEKIRKRRLQRGA